MRGVATSARITRALAKEIGLSTDWNQGCLFCGWSGIDEEHSYPAEGPSYYSMGEPPHIEPCICQYGLEYRLAAWEEKLLREFGFEDQ